MSEETLRKLETYKEKKNFSDPELAEKMGVYPNYPFRWRKAGRIVGLYKKYVEDFLKKEERRERRKQKEIEGK